MMQALGAAILALCLSAPFAGAGQAELQALMAEIEGKVGELADAVELWQGRRCQLDVVGQEACQDKNYHACEPPASSPSPRFAARPRRCDAIRWLILRGRCASSSGGTKFPNPVCQDGSQTPKCGAACGSIRDYSTSAVRIAGVSARDQGNLSPLIKETMCWTQKLDQTFLAHKAHFSASGNFASDDELPQMYFGDDAVGLFRMLPAVYQDTGGPYGCGAYDPRVRPWYTNTVSPPKDVVILIDASGSMRTGGTSPFYHALRTAQFIIERFSPSDAFAVVVFATRFVQIFPENGGMVRGTLENKANAVGALLVDELTEGLGWSSDQVGAFNEAFDILAGAAAANQTMGCRKSIMLLSDNTASIGYTPETDVPGTIATRNAALSEQVVVFTYAMGASATSDGGVGKSIACQTGGVWAAVPESTDEALKESLSGFYSFYTAAVADADNHVVWAEPFAHASTGFLGTSCAKPVFDRTDPDNPVLIGVVALDMLVRTMERLLGGDAQSARAAAVAEITSRNSANCPNFAVTECELQSLRRASGGSPAMCPNQCSDTSEMAAVRACLPPSDYPREDLRRNAGDGTHERGTAIEYDVWHNNPNTHPPASSDGWLPHDYGSDLWTWDFESVACCSIGLALPSTYGNWNDPTYGICSNVDERNVGTTDANAEGDSYMLVAEPVSWSEARDACQANGGQLANIRSVAEEATISALLDAQGVHSAWLCNEVKLSGREYSNWGSDVPVTSESRYYEPVDMPDCSQPGIQADDCSALEREPECSKLPRQPCECHEYEYPDMDSCQALAERGQLEDGTRFGEPEDETGCFCHECPAGMRVRRDEEELILVTDDYDCVGLHCPVEHCVRAVQEYDGAWCGHMRTRRLDGQDVTDWGEEECGRALPYVCNLRTDQDFLPHCYIPLERRSAAWSSGISLAGCLAAVFIALTAL